MATRSFVRASWAIAAVAPLLTTAAVVPPSAADSDTPTMTMTSTPLGCDITVRAHNRGDANVTIDLEDSEVKVRRGIWKKLNQGGNWVVNEGGDHESRAVSLNLGCNFNRQYKFLMRSGGDSKYIYFPRNDFTKSRSLGLANIGRHF